MKILFSLFRSTDPLSGTKTAKENAAILAPAVVPPAGAAAVVAGRLRILRVAPALGRDEYTCEANDRRRGHR